MTEKLTTPAYPNFEIDPGSQLLLPEHVVNENKRQLLTPSALSPDQQELKAQSIVIGTEGAGSLRNETQADRDEQARLEAKELRREHDKSELFSLSHILELKEDIDRTTDRDLADRTFSFDKRLDKDGSQHQRAADLKEDRINKYIQKITGKPQDEMTSDVLKTVTVLVSLPYKELEQRLAESEAKKLAEETRASRARRIEALRDSETAHQEDPIDFAESESWQHQTWVNDTAPVTVPFDLEANYGHDDDDDTVPVSIPPNSPKRFRRATKAARSVASRSRRSNRRAPVTPPSHDDTTPVMP